MALNLAQIPGENTVVALVGDENQIACFVERHGQALGVGFHLALGLRQGDLLALARVDVDNEP